MIDTIDSGTSSAHVVEWFDRNGAAASPLQVFVSIHCPVPARTVRAETALTGPFTTTTTIEVTAAENTIVSSRVSESRRITARAVDIGGDTLVTHADYTVRKAT